MAFWTKTDCFDASSDEGTSILEDWELETLSPGTYEYVSDMVISRWKGYKYQLGEAIKSGEITLDLKDVPMDSVHVTLRDMKLKRTRCTCAEDSDTAYWLDVIVIAELDVSVPDYDIIKEITECRDLDAWAVSNPAQYERLCEEHRNTISRKEWFRLRSYEDALNFHDDDGSWSFAYSPDISVYKPEDNLTGVKLTDCLVGVLSLEQIEEISERRLKQHNMLQSIEEKGYVDMWEYAHKIGAEIRFAKLSFDGKIGSKLGLPGEKIHVYEYYGKTRPNVCTLNGQLPLERIDAFYADPDINVGAHPIRSYAAITLKFDKATILIDPYVCDTESREEDGIAHECFHLEEHPRFFLLQNHQKTRIASFNMTEEDYDAYEVDKERDAELALTQKGKENTSSWDEIDWVEWQARMGAVRKRMPRSVVRKKVQKLYNKYYQLYPYMSELKIMSLVITDLALTFHVSKEIARIRVEEVGFDIARGTTLFMDGHYVPAHRTTSGKFEKNITYAISEVDAARLYAEDEQFYNTLNTGYYVFVDNFFCLNSTKYIDTVNGEMHLNDNALGHIEQCCIGFRVSYRRRSSCYDTAALHSDMVYSNPIAEAMASVPMDDIMLSQEEIDAKCAELPQTFGDTLIYHRKQMKVSQEDLAYELGMRIKDLREYEKDEVAEPSRTFCISVARILRLPGYFTRDLMKKAHCPLEFTSDNYKHLNYLIEFLYMRPLLELDRYTKKFHLPALIGRRDEMGS